PPERWGPRPREPRARRSGPASIGAWVPLREDDCLWAGLYARQPSARYLRHSFRACIGPNRPARRAGVAMARTTVRPARAGAHRERRRDREALRSAMAPQIVGFRAIRTFHSRPALSRTPNGAQIALRSAHAPPVRGIRKCQR